MHWKHEKKLPEIEIEMVTAGMGELCKVDKKLRNREVVFLSLGRGFPCDFPQLTTFGCSSVPLGPQNSLRWFASENHSEKPFLNFVKPTPYLGLRPRVPHSMVADLLEENYVAL